MCGPEFKSVCFLLNSCTKLVIGRLLYTCPFVFIPHNPAVTTSNDRGLQDLSSGLVWSASEPDSDEEVFLENTIHLYDAELGHSITVRIQIVHLFAQYVSKLIRAWHEVNVVIGVEGISHCSAAKAVLDSFETQVLTLGLNRLQLLDKLRR